MTAHCNFTTMLTNRTTNPNMNNSPMRRQNGARQIIAIPTKLHHASVRTSRNSNIMYWNFTFWHLTLQLVQLLAQEQDQEQHHAHHNDNPNPEPIV
jgi:hypothetical protein